MKGQPYHWEAEAIKSAINIEREECARIADECELPTLAMMIRARGLA
jgi:hypothetical protein